MKRLLDWWWAVRLAMYVCKIDQTSFAAAWRDVHKWWWWQYREGGFSPRDAVLEAYLRGHKA